MIEYLNQVRKSVVVSGAKKIIYPLAILVLGIILGIFSKMLDEIATNLLPQFIQYLDLRNFFSRMAIWIFVATCISIYSKSPIRAGMNVLLFFIGMVSSYYLYTIFIAGFFPKSYMIVWFVITLFTPFLGAICWYAKGTHIVSVIISSLIYAIMGILAFSLQNDFSYFGIRYILELTIFIASIGVLYVNKAQIIKVVLIGTVLFIFLQYTPVVNYMF